MKNSARVRERYGFANSQKKSQTFGKRRYAVEKLIDTRTLHKFHNIKNPAVGQSACVVHRNDARMLELREHTRFAYEPLFQSTEGVGRVQHFDRDAAVQCFILRCINSSHAATRQKLQQAVTRP